jgi:hypothetical protein
VEHRYARSSTPSLIAVLLAASTVAAAVASQRVTSSGSIPPALFVSRETGTVPLIGFAGNVLDPYGEPPPSRISIQLPNMAKRALFGRLELRHATIASAAIMEPRLGTRFELHGVSVLGVSVNRSAPPSRPEIHVSLAVERFTVTSTPRPRAADP